MKRFITSNTPDTQVLFENFGISVYYAQLLEGCLKSILVAAELQGRIKFDRQKDLRLKEPDDDLLKACIGPMLKVLEKNKAESDSAEFFTMIEKANDARNLLVHRFILDHSFDLLNQAGRRSINDTLGRLFLTIVQAHSAAEAVRNALFKEWGVTEVEMNRHMQELKELYGDEKTDE